MDFRVGGGRRRRCAPCAPLPPSQNAWFMRSRLVSFGAAFRRRRSDSDPTRACFTSTHFWFWSGPPSAHRLGPRIRTAMGTDAVLFFSNVRDLANKKCSIASQTSLFWVILRTSDSQQPQRPEINFSIGPALCTRFSFSDGGRPLSFIFVCVSLRSFLYHCITS